MVPDQLFGIDYDGPRAVSDPRSLRDAPGLLRPGRCPASALPSNFDPATAIFGADRIGEGELRIVSDPLEVLSAQQNSVQAVCFLTETVASLQLEMLSSLLDEKQCELVF
jgi:hypothetical protein